MQSAVRQGTLRLKADFAEEVILDKIWKDGDKAEEHSS